MADLRVRPVVVGLGPVDRAVVQPILGDVRFIESPAPADLAVAVGAIVRADAVSTPACWHGHRA
jgi:D-3-phosphoglycerate dehydrogenase